MSVTPQGSSNRRLGKSVLQLATGTAVSQVIVFVSTPIITRFYSPRDFGVAAFFLSFMIFLAPLYSLNYYQAIVLPRHESDALTLNRLSLYLSLVIGLLLLGGFALGREILDTRFQMPELVPYFWLIPATILIRSLYLVLAAFMSRHRRFALQARARVIQTLTERLLTLGAAFVGQASSLMLVFARVISTVCETAMLLYAFLRRPRSEETAPSPGKSLRELAVAYRDFPIYSNWSMLLANGSAQLPIFLLPLFFGPAVAGYYALGGRLIQLPMQLLGESIRSAYYKEVSDHIHAGGETRSSFETLRLNLVKVGMFPFAFLLCYGGYLFGIFFGAAWVDAGSYAGILGFFFFFQFTSTPITSIFNAYRKQKYLMIISGLLFANSLLSLCVGAYFNSPRIGFVLMAGLGIVIYLFMNYLAERTVGASHSRQFVAYARTLLINLPFIAIFFLVRAATENPLIVFTIALVLAVIYYGLQFRAMIPVLKNKQGCA